MIQDVQLFKKNTVNPKRKSHHLLVSNIRYFMFCEIIH